MYQDTLKKQWNDLADDFVSDNRKLPAQMRTVDRLNAWYRTAVYRFSSIASLEGISLNQENNEPFAQELRARMSAFRFEKAAPAKKPNLWLMLAAALAAGVAAAFLLPLLPAVWLKRIWVRILLGVVAFALAAGLQLTRALSGQEKQEDRDFQSYVQQLKDCLPGLIEVCEKYRVK